MSTEIVKRGDSFVVEIDGTAVADIVGIAGAVDSFIRLSSTAFFWTRRVNEPTVNMRMELVTREAPTFTMIPSVSYNGNGWGTTPEYVGDRAEDGTPWSFAWHRVTIPSCTFSATPIGSVALMAEAGEDTACSLYREDDKEKHVVIYPEEEKPKTLQRHFWGDAYQGEGKPRTEFTAIVLAYPYEDKPIRYDGLLDFAWRYYGHALDVPMQPERIYDLGITYTRYLYQRMKDGFSGFVSGAQWFRGNWTYQKNNGRFGLSWVGQSASMANAMIYHYLQTGDKEALEMGIGAHDAWLKYGKRECGLLDASIDYGEWRHKEYAPDYEPDPWQLGEAQYEDHKAYGKRKFRRGENGVIELQIDACNSGGGAENYFEAYELAKKAGIDKPEYLEAAYGILDFALTQQNEEGRYAKSWKTDGTVLSANGTIGCFLILPMLLAYQRCGDKKYYDSAIRAFDYYYGALERDGFTTAGALDTYCIDKESSSPLLRASLALYDLTKEEKYVTASENIAHYLSTWLMHYTIEYPDDSVLGKMGYDTFGSTSVSTAHQALDQYALRDVISFLHLAEITGNKQWHEKALVFYANASQCISDGTMYVNGRVRPAGSQDEAIFHTRWGRHGVPPFMPSQWLPAWPTAFRLEILRWYEGKWDLFRNGISGIDNAIAHVK